MPIPDEILGQGAGERVQVTARPERAWSRVLETPRVRPLPDAQATLEDGWRWTEVFSTSKTHARMPVFTSRTRTKVEVHPVSADVLVVEGRRVVEVLAPGGSRRFLLKDVVPESAQVRAADARGAVLQWQNVVAYLSFETGRLAAREVAWKPVGYALAKGTWFVGTREASAGPGEVHAFARSDGRLRWSVELTESVESSTSPTGRVVITPWGMKCIGPGDALTFSSLDRIYHLGADGSEGFRVLTSGVREDELAARDVPAGPHEPAPARVIFGREAAAGAPVPHEDITVTAAENRLAWYVAWFDGDLRRGLLFSRPGSVSRVFAWSPSGSLRWTRSLLTGFKPSWDGARIRLLTFSGHVAWMDAEGRLVAAVPVPGKPVAAHPIPATDRLLVECEDERRYEHDPASGSLTELLHDEPGARPLAFDGRLLYHDGHLWLAPEASAWQAPAPRAASEASAPGAPSGGPPMEVKADRAFARAWTARFEGDRRLGGWGFHPRDKRVFLTRDVPFDAEEALRARAAGQPLTSRQELLAVDAGLRVLWHRVIPRGELRVAKDGETLLLYVHGRTDPGNGRETPGAFHLLDAAGQHLQSLEAPAFGSLGEFLGRDAVGFSAKDGDFVLRRENGAWALRPRGDDEPDEALRAGPFVLTPTSGKRYVLSSPAGQHEVKVTATLQEALPLPDGRGVVARTQKALRALSPTAEPLWEHKSNAAILAMVPCGPRLLLLTKEDATLLDADGRPLWTFATPAKPTYNEARWLGSKGLILWVAGDVERLRIALLDLDGRVVHAEDLTDAFLTPGLPLPEDASMLLLQQRDQLSALVIP